MGYAAKKIDYAQARSQAGEYDYALIYGISGITLCPAAELAPVDWEECLEARFFSPDRELHFFEREGQLEAVEVADVQTESQMQETIRKYKLAGRYGSVGSCLCVKEYRDFDEDGQIGVALTRLCGIK